MQGVHRQTITKWRKKGRIKGHLADGQGQSLFENPGEISLRIKKKKN
jgi:predicted site-specific integrase-resolvase